MAFKDAAHIFARLRNGTVPDRGLDAFAVGIERHRKELQRKLAEAKSGQGDVKFLRGGYGCGKTFMANLVVHDAQAERFATSFVVVSVNDLHFDKFDELYRKVVTGLSTPACAQGALGDILDRWIGGIEEGLLDLKIPEEDPAFDTRVLEKLDEQLAALTGGRAPADMIRVVRRFPERLQHAIAHHLGFTSLRPVQELAGEVILDGKNAVVLAPTAGGKTEASIFPVLAGLLAEPPTGVGAIYVAPIKALLNNQEVRLGDYTQMVGLRRFVWHGDAAQSQKEAFCRDPAELLMTTPESLEVMTFQANAPSTVSSFLQRMGRTGRREGAVANMTFLCDDAVSVVQSAALVLLASRGWVESVPDTQRAWPVLVRQVLAMTQEHGGISVERCWQMLSRVPDFRGIEQREYVELVDHMKKEGYLFESGGLLSLGQAAEKAFGKKNFLELYAVFSSPVLYKVQTEAKRDLGSLEQAFVDRLVEDMSTFLLGGRAWMVVAVNHDERTVRVRSAPRGKRPSWGGFLPQFLGFHVCQEMKAVLTSDDEYSFLDAKAKGVLAEWQGDLGQLLRGGAEAMQFDGDTVAWWTFAGGRINQTLKYALEWKGGFKVVPDNAYLLDFDGAARFVGAA